MEIQPTIQEFETNTLNWHKYNLAKTREKELFYKLLSELCLIIPEEPYKFGRPFISTRDLFFSACLKLYSNYTGRKISTDLKHAQALGYIKKAPHYNTLSDFLCCPITYDLLQKLLTISAMPLKSLEDSYSIDSSGFGTYQYERWMKAKFENKKGWRNYLKGHITIGTRTNVICSCEVTRGTESDVAQAEKLIQHTADNFQMREFSGDKAYSTRRVHQLIESLGAMPFIAFRDNVNPNPKTSPEIWIRMHRYFTKHKEEFLKKYHKRSNVETTFGMVKQRLGEHLKSKKFDSQRSELLIKFICHNICCLIQEVFESEAHIDFKKALDNYVDRKVSDQKLEKFRENYKY